MLQNDKALLQRLGDQRVEFVIIGGVCGLMHGSGLTTLDMDICCPFSPGNLKRLAATVKDLNPYHRQTPQKLPLELTDELCGRLKNLYLATDLGFLDCLSEVAGIGGYAEVLKHSVIRKLSYGEFKILSLEALIRAKQAVGREKDLFAVKLLRAIQSKTDLK